MSNEAYEAFKGLVNERKKQGVLLALASAYYPESDECILHPIFFWVNKDATKHDVTQKFIKEYVEHELKCDCNYQNGKYIIDSDYEFTIEDCKINVYINADIDEVWNYYCEQTVDNVNHFRGCTVW